MLDALFPHDVPGWLWISGAWVLTYILHSTVLLGGVFLAISRQWIRPDFMQETLWKFAILGGLFSASIQVGLGVEPFGGTIHLLNHERLEQNEPVPGDGLNSLGDRELPDTLVQETPRNLNGGYAEKTPVHERPVLGAGRTTDRFLTRRLPSSSDTWDDPGTTDEAIMTGTDAKGDGANIRGWMVAVSGLCLLIGLFGLGGLAWSWVRLKGRLTGRVEIEDGPLMDMLERLHRRAGLGKTVRLTSSSRVSVPMAIGILHPEICIPVRAGSDLGTPEQESMLAHELAHLVRKDPAWLCLFRVVGCLFFFQPLNRLARRRWQEIAEYRSDAWAVDLLGGSIPLARCLTEVADWIIGSRTWWKGAAVHGMAENRSILAGRITRLLHEPKQSGGRDCRPWLMPILLVFLLFLTGAVPSITLIAGVEDGAVIDGIERVESAVDIHEPAYKESAGLLLAREMKALDLELALLEEEAHALRNELEMYGYDEATGSLLDRLEAHLQALRAKRARMKVRFNGISPDIRPDIIRHYPVDESESGG